MRPSPKIRFDVASAVSQGQRDYQEDAIIADFPLGAGLGFAVLADGMGGHSAGDVASKIVVTEVFSELKIQSGNPEKFEANVTEILLEAVLGANACVKGHVSSNPETEGMGTTLVCPVFIQNRLYWISVGDSPLFLYRDGELSQLNEDHSMAPQIDFMVSSGLLDEEAGKDHPDRNCLTSVLIGNKIARVDCPKEPFAVHDGDVLIVASDGLQFLSNDDIERFLAQNSACSSYEIADRLLAELKALDDPDQDNVTLSVIKILHSERVEKSPSLQIATEDGTAVSHQSANPLTGPALVARSTGFRPLQFLRRARALRDGAL